MNLEARCYRRIEQVMEENRRMGREIMAHHVPTVARLVHTLVAAFRRGNKVVLFGNGGSAADAQHVAAELVNRLSMERCALPAIALTTDTSILTCISNDYCFSDVFARQIEALVNPGDVAVGISTSGNSPNVLEGLRAARRKGALTIGFTGRDGGRLKDLVDICFQAPSNSTPRIQEAHITIWHIVCGLVEQEMFGALEWAVFLDRDGAINVEVEYLGRPEQLRLLPGSAEAIRMLNEAGAKVVVVTNQAGVARGYFTERDVEAVHVELARQLERAGAHLDGIYYCPHHPTAGIGPYRMDCARRKPNPGMLYRAARELGLDLRRSVLVGDKLSDIEAGVRAGCRTVLVLTGYGEETAKRLQDCSFQPDFVASDLLEAVQWILSAQDLPLAWRTVRAMEQQPNQQPALCPTVI